MIGTILDGRYRILKLLGAGGMGEVFLGEHLQLKRQEAVKILKSRFARDEGHLARFRREARATNRVQHPNIVGFYDFGKLPDGRLYLTMEFADGPDLQKCLEDEGRFDAPRAVAILRQLASAIHYAHSKGVIHRDLKPENLILTQEPGRPDMVKILDFGVAKITAPGYLESMAITREGQVFGTPAYVAPEQIRGVRDDPRIDIYALGCIAYELLTGETPFVGRPMKVIEGHMSETPPPCSQRCLEAQIPRELDEIVMHCLVKEPDKRPQTAGEVADLLASLRLERSQVVVGRGQGDGTLSGFESEATVEGVPTALVIEDEESRTTDVFESDHELELRRVLRKLAEGICDLGASDPSLLVLLAEANQLEQELADLREELGALARSDELVAQKAREGEASLRFAIGELKFELSEGETSSESANVAVAELTRRLADLAEHTRLQHASITEKQINMTSTRADKQEELQALDQRLGELIDKHADSVRGSSRMVRMLSERARIVKLIADRKDKNKPVDPILP